MVNIVIELFLLSIGASFVQRTTGFGFGIFIMTMLPSIMPSYGEATTLSGLLAMTTSLIIVVQKYKYISWSRLLPILLTFIIVSICAIFMLKRMEYGVLNILLGIMLILTSIYFTFFSKRIKVKTTMPVQITAGTLSGLMGGFFGMQGPPAVLYFVSSEPDKEHYLAMTQTYFLMGNLMMTMARAYNGFFTSTVSIGYIYGISGVVVGNLIGAWLFKHITGSLLKYIIYAYIGILGGIGVGFSAQYGWQAVFNTFGALAIATETYGLQGAVSLRVIQNVFGVVFALAFCVIFYWFMSKKKESDVTVHAE